MVALQRTVIDFTPSSRPAPPQPSLAEDLAVLDEHAEAVLAAVTQRVREMEAEAVRGLKALALAPTLPLYNALMRGERVPWNTLDFFQAERHGLRHRHPDRRYGLDDFNDVPRP
jgi:hypothetical protein